MTLVELLVALVLLGIVSAALYRVLVNNQRVYQSQTQRIELQQSIRAGATILPADLRELDASEGDVISATATDITFRAMRWIGYICQAPVTGPSPLVTTPTLTFTVMNKGLAGVRSPTVGDSVMIRYEGDEGTRFDDAWVPGQVTLIQAQNCPAGLPYNSTPGQRITATAWMPNAAAGPQLATPNNTNSIYVGAPVRGFVDYTYQLYQPAGDTSWYVGLLRPGNAIQPVIGPVLSNGLSLLYFNDTTPLALNPALPNDRLRIGSVLFTLRARTPQQVRSGSGGTTTFTNMIDSVTVRVALRNNRRY
jgi:prepilin-type N-terminal cleavage/methylation domain-containing protein